MKNKILFSLLIVSVLIISVSLYLNRANTWGGKVNGLVCRISPVKDDYKIGDEIEVVVEFKNITSNPIVLFDFQDNPPAWPAEASYFRGMVLGFNQDPIIYHMRTSRINRLVTLEPGKIYSFVQRHNISGELRASSTLKMIYDTKMIERYWNGEYWKGRIESNIISFPEK